MARARRLAALAIFALALALAGCPARKDLCPPGDHEKVCPPRETPRERSRRSCIQACRDEDDLAILRSQLRGAEALAMEQGCIADCMDRLGAPGYSPPLLSECDRQYDLVCGLFRWGREGDPTVSEKIRESLARPARPSGK